jgi:hypothetical protein
MAVYAYENSGQLTFSGMCSNSRAISNLPIQFQEQNVRQWEFI